MNLRNSEEQDHVSWNLLKTIIFKFLDQKQTQIRFPETQSFLKTQQLKNVFQNQNVTKYTLFYKWRIDFAAINYFIHNFNLKKIFQLVSLSHINLRNNMFQQQHITKHISTVRIDFSSQDLKITHLDLCWFWRISLLVTHMLDVSCWYENIICCCDQLSTGGDHGLRSVSCISADDSDHNSAHAQ